MPQDKRPFLIGITGNIGSGKSTISKMIVSAGYQLIYADDSAHEALNSAEVISQVSGRWGKNLVINGRIDRSSLSRIVFNDPAELTFLNSLIHPIVLREFNKIVSQSDEVYLFFEIPLLFEEHLQDRFDLIVLVTSPMDQRIKRIMLRDGVDSQSALARISNQMNDKDKLAYSEVVINNDSSLADLQIEVQSLLDHLYLVERKTVRPFI